MSEPRDLEKGDGNYAEVPEGSSSINASNQEDQIQSTLPDINPKRKLDKGLTFSPEHSDENDSLEESPDKIARVIENTDKPEPHSYNLSNYDKKATLNKKQMNNFSPASETDKMKISNKEQSIFAPRGLDATRNKNLGNNLEENKDFSINSVGHHREEPHSASNAANAEHLKMYSSAGFGKKDLERNDKEQYDGLQDEESSLEHGRESLSGSNSQKLRSYIREENKLGDLVNEIKDDDEQEDEDPDELIKLINVHKTYLMGLEGVQALRGVNLTVRKGEFVTILGTSGGGKTTMLNIIGTIDKPTKGDLYLCGLRVKSNTQDKLLASIRLNKVAFVFQSFNLISSLSATENVELPMQLKGGMSRSKIHKRAKDLLTKVGLGDRLDHFPNQLSGGEQQRVTIARALSNEPTILLLDEPTGDLDTRSSDIVMKIIMDLNLNDNITMVMVTHDVALKGFASKIVRMSDGRIGSIEEISNKERMKNYNKLRRRVENIANGEDKDKLNVREGVQAYDQQDDESDEGSESEEEKEVSKRIFDKSVEETAPQDPGINRGLPNRMRFIQNARTSKTSVRMPGDYPYKKKVCYLD
ncbi:unnamed protein product [Moneuplotes crassus]|uniref:ABC transporter domain-containing protein n=1 Tax=Euplotes crassus TaxID=5936 RepID=A0AAD1U3U4_EUPCR|nr:unnamed protein product [Moneuplotes crassus]